ncbi:hypothetical protein Pan44_38890 [Caulifigura coniformis]|uniref:DUF288 domain-containing protein n=1 Tax=Caulifigura coniformis TaxID=2527983 RepID=A0A517SI89_9PLAN|nr:STELLO glycosyltransferase family protein [Caulifigura coniformis]QDT55841.1 hypothetical protein Pan44_38890 [Caulifigura coniformis]
MLYAVITTIQEPTDCVRKLAKRLPEAAGRLVVIGDKKGPKRFDGGSASEWPVDFLDLAAQQAGPFKLGNALPVGHYARKNIGYLQAIASGASCVYETDDDNAPLPSWQPRTEQLSDVVSVGEISPARWVNVYRYFSKENIWPRGLPLDEIRKGVPELIPVTSPVRAPIQQGLVDGSPDVDAIWRLVLDHAFEFDRGRSVHLPPGNWCPFNTQSTWWWPTAFPLLYIPSYCSFRMCDIWKSFVAQRCLWALKLGVVFHASEVFQDRNMHDLTRDFNDEVPGYQLNRRITDMLAELPLSDGVENVGKNMRSCYARLVEAEIFPEKELVLVDAWLDDLTGL